MLRKSRLRQKKWFSCLKKKRVNNEKCFLAFQSILFDKDFSKYVKNLFKVQESNSHIAKSILSTMNMTEIISVNIDSL